MSEGNGSRILPLISGRLPKDRGSDLASKNDVARMIAEECTKVHEYYLQQIPRFVANMVMDALVEYKLVKDPRPKTEAEAVAGVPCSDEPSVETAPIGEMDVVDDSPDAA